MNIDSLFEQALSLHRANQLPQADSLYRQVLAIDPRHPAALQYLGLTLAQRRRPEEAYPLMSQSVALAQDAGFYSNFGALCRSLNKVDEAEAAYLASIRLNANAPATYNNLANLYADQGRLLPAIESFRKALALDPNYSNAQLNLANTLIDAGEWAEAFTVFRRELNARPNPVAHSSLCLNLHYDPAQTAQSIFAENQRWNSLYTRTTATHLPNDPDPDRPLRIGYVSPDFCEHPAAHVILPLLENHDRSNYIVHLYSTVNPAEVLPRFRTAAAVFRECDPFAPDRLVSLIRDDKIDILVDLANHSGFNSLLVFGQKPAAIQFTAIGLPATTGLTAIDYRFTDSFFDPPAPAAAKPSSEKLVYLDPAAWCYDPGQVVENPAPPPSLKNDYITFGSLSNLLKINEPLVDLWAKVLLAVPHSRFAAVSGALLGRSAFGRDRLLSLFAARGIPADRLVLLDRTSRQEYFGQYQQIDIVLDTFPFHGGVTTLDALYMGVPVITLAGETYTSLTGVSILSNLDLPELITHSAEEYLAAALALAGDERRLVAYHQTLRDRLRSSALMGAAAYARRVESAYRQSWKSLCLARA